MLLLVRTLLAECTPRQQPPSVTQRFGSLGVSDDPATLRQMSLYWGVTPLAGAAFPDTAGLLDHVCSWGLREGRLSRGDRILLVAGSSFGTGGHNMALVHEV